MATLGASRAHLDVQVLVDSDCLAEQADVLGEVGKLPHVAQILEGAGLFRTRLCLHFGGSAFACRHGDGFAERRRVGDGVAEASPGQRVGRGVVWWRGGVCSGEIWWVGGVGGAVRVKRAVW